MSGFNLDDDDVVCFGALNYCFTENVRTAKVNEIKQSLLNTWLAGHLAGWVSTGIACRVLKVSGGGWQAGKIRFQMEFIPNEPKVPEQKPSTVTSEPVSPLADLRSNLEV